MMKKISVLLATVGLVSFILFFYVNNEGDTLDGGVTVNKSNGVVEPVKRKYKELFSGSTQTAAPESEIKVDMKQLASEMDGLIKEYNNNLFNRIERAEIENELRKYNEGFKRESLVLAKAELERQKN